MDTLFAARTQMAVSLAFHMVFAALGIGLPLLMALAEWRWLRTRAPHWREVARTWAKATALTFVVGAVSGTALAFELGLLWPAFMERYGAVLGPAFTLEAYAFFLEAIFLGLYLYGWDRLSPWAHWWTGVAVAVSGMASGVLVVAANSYMHTPIDVDLAALGDDLYAALAVFRTPSWLTMATHSTLACYAATGFAVAAVAAAGILRGRDDLHHRSCLGLGMLLGGMAALVQPISGDFSARMVAATQPVKLAAMEAHFETMRGAPLWIGGLPDVETREVRYGIPIPGALSLLLEHDPDAEVPGLDQFPRDDWPNVVVTHLAFQVMVGIGLFLVALTLWFWIGHFRRRRARSNAGALPRRLLGAIVAAGPLAFVALEAGWFVTEVGRQPWIVHGRMRTAEAVTPIDDVATTLLGFVVLYVALAITLTLMLLGLARRGRARRKAAEADG